ncbi:MAG: SAM-dependent methyltransferase [Bdellovibrionales bacterium]|nr:SAM-dependent methyltransferase [Bdellovibrionales bacterium]
MAQNFDRLTAKPTARRFRWIAPTTAGQAPDLEITKAYGRGGVVVEIGCGVGWHSITYCRNHPEKIVIAIERTRDKFSRFKSRILTNAPIPNLIPAHGDALRLLPPHLENLSIDSVFILYPNPEPKAKAQRWIHMPFLDLLREALCPEGRVVFATNVQNYADEILATAPSRGWLVSKDKRINICDNPDFQPRTHFEKKYFLRGETLRHIELKKKDPS